MTRLSVTLGDSCPDCQAKQVEDSAMLRVNAIFQLDPTRTITLRHAFMRDMDNRFNALKSDIRVSIIQRDCFGIQPILLALAATAFKAFDFPRTADKVDGFMGWIEEQERIGILEITRRPGGLRGGIEEAWTDTYVHSSYARGVTRGRAELRRAGYDVRSIDDIPGGIQNIMSQPFHADRVGVLYTRTFEDLKSVTQVMNAQTRRLIAEGLTTGLARGIAEGKSPVVIARELYKDVANRVDKIGKVRARMIARTEVVRAHHAATIQEYMQADAEMTVGVKAEWSTAGFAVCPICAGMEGQVFKLREAEGMIPAHPNCRCVMLPIVQDKDKRAATPSRALGPSRARPSRARPSRARPSRARPISTKPGYTPQTTLEGAEKWATTKGGVREVFYEQDIPFMGPGLGSPLSKKKALTHFNAINVAMDDMQRRHNIKLPHIDALMVTDSTRGQLSTWVGARNKPLFAMSVSREWTSNIWRNNKAWEKSKGKKWDWTPDESHIAVTVRHEYSHVMDRLKNVSSSRSAVRLRETLRTDFNFTMNDISEYASENAQEWFAEAMSHYTSPLYRQVQRFPKPLEDFLEGVLDKFRRKT